MLLSAFRRDDKYHILPRKIEQKDLITLCTLLLQKDGANGERGKKKKGHFTFHDSGNIRYRYCSVTMTKK